MWTNHQIITHALTQPPHDGTSLADYQTSHSGTAAYNIRFFGGWNFGLLNSLVVFACFRRKIMRYNTVFDICIP